MTNEQIDAMCKLMSEHFNYDKETVESQAFRFVVVEAMFTHGVNHPQLPAFIYENWRNHNLSYRDIGY